MPRIPEYPEQIFESVFIPLTRGHTAVIDAADLPLLQGRSWHSNGRYAITWEGKVRGLFMHRLLLGLAFGDPIGVDHINGDGFDNRRSNLRVATQQQNGRNMRRKILGVSGFKGVAPNHGRWRAAAYISNRKVYLGTFDTPELAADAYDAFTQEHFGVFARPNRT